MRPDSAGGRAFEHFSRVLDALSPDPERERMRAGALRRLFVDDSRQFPTIDTGYGDVPIIHASAGVRRIVSLAYLIVWAWHEHLEASKLLKTGPVKNLVFLMDEVENHLHPAWQRRIVPALLGEATFTPRGDASRWLRSPAFNLPIPRSIEAERAMNDANAVMRVARSPPGSEKRLQRIHPADFEDAQTHLRRFMEGEAILKSLRRDAPRLADASAAALRR